MRMEATIDAMRPRRLRFHLLLRSLSKPLTCFIWAKSILSNCPMQLCLHQTLHDPTTSLHSEPSSLLIISLSLNR